MTHRSLLISATSAIALTVWAPRSPGVVSAQGKAPPVSVYVAALRGDCAPDRQFTVVNGQTFVYPANTARDGKRHKINVVISKPGAAVRARQGYRAPEGDKGQSR
jgi:hypothetical protein